MFADPLWSLLLLAVPILIYRLIISPRLRVRFTETYAHLDSLWDRIKARLYAFRTFWIGLAGIVVTAAPDLLVLIAPIDFSPFLPQPWPAYTGPITSAIIVLMKAFETKPREEQ